VTPIRLESNIAKKAGVAIQQQSAVRQYTVGYPSDILASCITKLKTHLLHKSILPAAVIDALSGRTLDADVASWTGYKDMVIPAKFQGGRFCYKNSLKFRI